MIARLIHLWVAKHDENAARMTEHEPNLRFQNGDASGLAANQSASNIESAIGSGQKLVKVVAGNPAREFRIIMLDTISVPVAERLQLRSIGRKGAGPLIKLNDLARVRPNSATSARARPWRAG